MAYSGCVMSSLEIGKTRPSFAFELEYRRNGYQTIAGIDEAGRGALAGPVVAAAVVLPVDATRQVVEQIDDSKKLTIKQREEAFDAIREVSVSYGVGVVGADRIDAIGIVPSTKMAMREAIKANRLRIDFLLIDAVERIGIATPSKSIIRGDSQSLSIAAASIIAKVTRDRIMSGDMESRFPDYGFANHKGYGTAQHMKALHEFGPSPVHRRSFKPISQLIADASWNAIGKTSATNIARRGKLNLSEGLGQSGEEAAVEHIKRLGYRVLERNFKTQVGEVDIIARDGQSLVFVEVKSRNSEQLGSPIESVTRSKLRRIESVALAYLAAEVGTDDVDWRIDFLGVTRSADGRTMKFDLVRNVHY